MWKNMDVQHENEEDIKILENKHLGANYNEIQTDNSNDR